jgi:hypothetical protein
MAVDVKQQSGQQGQQGLQAAAAAQQQQQAAQAGKARTQSITGIAQELYRAIFFLVFYLEVLLVVCLPWVGERGGALPAPRLPRGQGLRGGRAGALGACTPLASRVCAKLWLEAHLQPASGQGVRACPPGGCWAAAGGAGVRGACAERGAGPCAGPAANFLLLSWLYAYYCYDYKWSLKGVHLAERLLTFERKWPFFAGGCGGVGGWGGARQWLLVAVACMQHQLFC